MSEKEDNLPERRGEKTTNRNKKKPGSSVETAPQKTDPEGKKAAEPKTEETQKAPEPEKPASKATAAKSEAEPVVSRAEENKASVSESPEAAGTRPASETSGQGGAPPASKGGGKLWFGVLAVALVLVAVGDAYYARLLAEREREARQALSEKLTEQLTTQVQSRVDSQVDKRLAGREEPLRQDVTTLKGEIKEHTDELQILQKEIEAVESSLRTLRSETEKGPKPGEWDIAEAAYLMRIANERLQLEQDVNTALVALQTADQILREVADPALTPVRSKLAEEINSLKAVPVPDIDGMALSLSSLVERVEKLELKKTVLEESKPVAETKEEVSGEDTLTGKAWEFLQVIWNDLKRFFVVRQRGEGEGGIPVLPPEERYFLYQNLRLELEAARLSLLRRSEDSFQQSLQLAQNWLQSYFQGSNAKVMKEILTKLEQTTINPSLPDISGSLKTLNRVWEGPGPQAARVGEGGKA